ncbi:hypothetical protein V6N11_036928 [Hibiscus sabdariffa]|uniref:Uncharacterized protein n=1 Tax=Hibiscus sabdariffa TaxID=183260 RepID=A0ABR2RC92_9ROSI
MQRFYDTIDFEAWPQHNMDMDILYGEEAWVVEDCRGEYLIDISHFEETWVEDAAYTVEFESWSWSWPGENSTATMDGHGGDNSEAKVSIPEWIFLIINILTELLSAAFDQLSSVNKHRYAFIAMLMSFAAAVTCIIELTYKAGKERVIWKWEGKLPWFYHSSPNQRRFGTFPEMVGLVCAILQTILSAIAYAFYLQHTNYPINISYWPLVFALGLFCSKFIQEPKPKPKIIQRDQITR